MKAILGIIAVICVFGIIFGYYSSVGVTTYQAYARGDWMCGGIGLIFVCAPILALIIKFTD